MKLIVGWIDGRGSSRSDIVEVAVSGESGSAVIAHIPAGGSIVYLRPAPESASTDLSYPTDQGWG